MLYSVRTGRPAFEHEFGMGLFEYFVQNPGAGDVFNEAMTGVMSQVADVMANTSDFSGFNTIVDIGGNHGTLITAILRRYPNAQGILFDRPNVVVGATERLAEGGVENRCKCVGG